MSNTWKKSIYSLLLALILLTCLIQGAGWAQAYRFVTQWGTYGTNVGQFSAPHQIAVDSSGNVYVADTTNHRIQKFTSAGAFVAAWGSYGILDGQFSSPHGVAVDSSGNVYVADQGNRRIQKFTSAGAFIMKWGTDLPYDGTFFVTPDGVAVDSSGNVYVVDTLYNRMVQFTSTGTFISVWGLFGYADGQLYRPTGTAVDSSGNVYVADTNNNRVQKFGSTGAFIMKFGSVGSGDGQLSYPSGVAVDSSGNVYVADTNNNRVQKFGSTGAFIMKFGSVGSGDGQLSYPSGVAVDSSGNLYVVDMGNNRVQKFALDTPPPPYLLSVVKQGTGSGSVTSAPSGIDCGTTCSASYGSGAPLILTGTPSSGSCFIGWGAPCSGYGPCTLNLTSDTSLPATFEPAGTSFCDVTPGTWAEGYINTIFAHNVTMGCLSATVPQDRRYCPSDLMTRDQMAAFIVRATAGEPPIDYCAGVSPFTDVDANGWACPYIKKLKELGLTTGYGSPTIYRPDLVVPRDQMAAFIIRATAGEPPIDYCAGVSPFTDVDANGWACPYIKKLKELGLTTGYGSPTIYRPDLVVPRDQMAAFLGRAFYGMQ